LATAPGSSTIFAGSGDGVIYARAAGTTGMWRPISPSLGGNPIFSLASNRQSHVLLAGTVGALYRGELDGSRWRWQLVAHTGESSISAITWLPGDDQRAFAAVFGSTPPVLSTSDGGRTWRADARGLPTELPSQALLPLPKNQSQVLLSTMGDGVWLRTPGGWREVSAGLPERHAMPLTGGTDGTLYAGTMGYGIYLKRGAEPWQRLGSELTGVDYTVLSLTISGGAQPYLLAGTARGVYRYPLAGR
jgi:hypothetical protein